MRSVIIITFFISLFGCSNFRGLSSVESPEKEISVLGDLEGNITRFNDFIDKSEALYRNPDGSLQIRDGHHFVFLGDVMDRGPGSLRIMNDLISLKEQSPDNVTIILGNRDINKLRIMSLMDTNINKNVHCYIVVPVTGCGLCINSTVEYLLKDFDKLDTNKITFIVSNGNWLKDSLFNSKVKYYKDKAETIDQLDLHIINVTLIYTNNLKFDSIKSISSQEAKEIIKFCPQKRK